MNRNRVMRGLGLIALVMLAFGLAGCGSEPAPVARPPAPPPAPPPFQPQAVEVALGESGETVTLMTAEGGGFTLNGEAFAGGEVTAENGNMYLLALADGTWTAAFQEPAGIEVMLGDHGGTVIITMSEDGKYFIGEMEITADTMVMGENGHYYTPGLDEEGMWVAMWVMPDAVSVMLGDHGGTVMLQLAEDNSWWIGEMAFASGENYMGDNGQYYMLTYDMESEMWMAMHMMPDAVSVMLGDHGGTVMLQQAEDMSWWIGETAFDSGGMQVGDNGHDYTLTYDMESGMWMAMWVKPLAEMVQLGTSGSVELQQAEDLSWWIGETPFDSGGTTTASNGNVFTLTYDMDSGMWSSAFMPMSMEIMGTGGLMAMSREDGMGYDVGDATLSEDGMGDITVGGETYRVMMMDGALMGTRLDPVSIDGDTDYKTAGLSAMPTILGDEDDTEDMNEAMTALTIAGENYMFADLLGDGMAEGMGDNFVAKAREELEGIRSKIEAVLDVFDDDDDRDRQVSRLWGTPEGTDTTPDKNVKDVLESVFGDEALDDLDAFEETGPDDNDALDEIDKLIDALSTVDGLAEALDDEGVLDGAPTNDMTAEEIFDATETESTVYYGMTGNTRYGTISRKARTTAVSDADNMEGDGELGAFAFGVTAETARVRHIATSGNAYYEGATLAVDGDGTPYSADISLRVRFATEKVDGLITNLRSTDGDMWVYVFGDVESIVLPTADLRSNGVFAAAAAAMADITFERRAGSPAPQELESTLNGRLLGTGDDAGYQAVGTWSVGALADGPNYLAGGFGAERTTDEPDLRPITDDGTVTKTTQMTMATDDQKTVLDDEMLKITVAKYGWTREDPAPSETTVDGVVTSANGPYFTWMRQDDDDPDTEEVETDNATRTYEIELADLLDSEGSEFNENGGNYVEMAREAIEKERAKLAVLIDTDQLEDSEQPKIWEKVQDTLRTLVFQANKINSGNIAEGSDSITNTEYAAYAALLPDEISGTYDPDTALDQIDDILDALSSASDLEEALDPDEGSLFVNDDDKAFVARAAGDIFAENDSQVKAWIGTTDFTRFGIWRVRRSRNALRSVIARRGGDDTDTDDDALNKAAWDDAESDTFAYSSLPATTVRTVTTNGDVRLASGYAPGGSAAYEGSTVAWVGTTGFEGDVDVQVTWALATANVGGMMTVVISNLENSNGDALYHESNENEIGSLVFPTVSVVRAGSLNQAGDDTTPEADDNRLVFRSSDEEIRVEYASRASVVEAEANSGTINGLFVGQTQDGPLGLIGQWTANAAASSLNIGTVNPDTALFTVFDGMIMGAFGAELP